MILIIGGLGYFMIFGSSPTKETPTALQATDTPTITYTMAEVMSHKTANDCWMVIDGRVYDVTRFIASREHNPEILRGCGLDATAMFEEERKHSKSKAQTLLTELVIGTLAS